MEAQYREHAHDHTYEREPPPLPEGRLSVGNGESHHTCGWQDGNCERRLKIGSHQKRRILCSGVGMTAPVRICLNLRERLVRERLNPPCRLAPRVYDDLLTRLGADNPPSDDAYLLGISCTCRGNTCEFDGWTGNTIPASRCMTTA